MHADIETCEDCKITWRTSFGVGNCPMCDLTEKIDQHMQSVLLQILTSCYSKYIFEIDEKSASLNKLRGFSPRVNRKHNLKYMRIVANINLKNTYLLLASHVESAFNDIQQSYRRSHGKNLPKVNSKIKLYHCFTEVMEEKRCDEHFFKSTRYFEIINYIRLIANIIKHNNSVITTGSILGKLIKIRNNINLQELWEIKFPRIYSDPIV